MKLRSDIAFVVVIVAVGVSMYLAGRDAGLHDGLIGALERNNETAGRMVEAAWAMDAAAWSMVEAVGGKHVVTDTMGVGDD